MFYQDSDVSDYHEDIINRKGEVYKYDPEGGPRFNGAYTFYFTGQLTYKQAKQKLKDIADSGFFEKLNFLYSAVEILTYNEGYQFGGFTTFEAWQPANGIPVMIPTRYQSIFPLNYTE